MNAGAISVVGPLYIERNARDTDMMQSIITESRGYFEVDESLKIKNAAVYFISIMVTDLVSYL